MRKADFVSWGCPFTCSATHRSRPTASDAALTVLSSGHRFVSPGSGYQPRTPHEGYCGPHIPHTAPTPGRSSKPPPCRFCRVWSWCRPGSGHPLRIPGSPTRDLQLGLGMRRGRGALSPGLHFVLVGLEHSSSRSQVEVQFFESQPAAEITRQGVAVMFRAVAVRDVPVRRLQSFVFGFQTVTGRTARRVRFPHMAVAPHTATPCKSRLHASHGMILLSG